MPAQKLPVEEFNPAVAPVARAAFTPFPVPDMTAGSQRPITPEELKAAALRLGLLAQQGQQPSMPQFNIDDLYQKKDQIDEMIKGVPLNLQPLAAFTDQIYGTQMSRTTPDHAADYLQKVKALRDLGGDSAALQQVKGQARLEQFKAELQDYQNKQGVQSPGEQAKMYKDLANALRGGSSESLALTKFITDIQRGNAAEQDRVSEMNRKIEGDLRNKASEIEEKFGKSDPVTNYEKVRSSARRTRDLIFSPQGGVPDYAVVTSFIKGLDPQSTVMFNEAAGIYNAGGIVDNILQTPDKWLNGGRLNPQQKEAILNTIARFEQRSKEAYEAARRGAIQKAADEGISNPQKVVKPVEERLKTGTQILQYTDDKGNSYDVPESEIGAFEDEMKKAKVKFKRAGSQ